MNNLLDLLNVGIRVKKIKEKNCINYTNTNDGGLIFSYDRKCKLYFNDMPYKLFDNATEIDVDVLAKIMTFSTSIMIIGECYYYFKTSHNAYLLEIEKEIYDSTRIIIKYDLSHENKRINLPKITFTDYFHDSFFEKSFTPDNFQIIKKLSNGLGYNL